MVYRIDICIGIDNIISAGHDYIFCGNLACAYWAEVLSRETGYLYSPICVVVPNHLLLSGSIKWGDTCNVYIGILRIMLLITELEPKICVI